MKELVRSMSLFPNLHTVRLRIPSSEESRIEFTASLESFSYPPDSLNDHILKRVHHIEALPHASFFPDVGSLSWFIAFLS